VKQDVFEKKIKSPLEINSRSIGKYRATKFFQVDKINDGILTQKRK